MTKPQLQKIFSQAYILGGSPCSGKSTIAEMLSAKYGFSYYKVDDHEAEHMQRARLDHQPVMFKYSKMSWDEIWSQPVEKLLSDEFTYYRERFPFILDDLSQLGPEKSVILEGAAFLPALISQYSVQRGNIVFMIPTLEFQLQHYQQRPWIKQILNECRNPEEAFDHWMKRDGLFGQEVTRQANDFGYQVIQVDGSVDIQTQFEIVEKQFRLGE